VEAEGYDVWWDADLPPHLSYGEVITDKIGDCKAAIVVWSKESAASEWVRAEADMARNQKKLVQTALNNVMPPLPFNQIQYAELGDWKGEADHPGWLKVKESLTALVGRKKRTRTSKKAAAAPAAAAVPVVAPPPAATPVMPLAARTPPKQLSNRTLLFGGLGGLAVALVLGLAVKYGQGTGDDAADSEQPLALVAPVQQNAPVTSAPTAAATTAPQAYSDNQNRQVMIVNSSSQSVREFYASPVTSDNWEEDMLGSGVLGPGESISANIDNGTGQCSFDLKAVMMDDTEHIQNGVNVCAVSRWTISDSGNYVE
jgi:hypothetical protein